MDLREFHQQRAAIQGTAHPGHHLDVARVETRLRDCLVETGFFESVEVEHTDDPDRLVIGLCRFRPFLVDAEVAMRIEEIWETEVRHPFWEAHSVHVEAGHVEFEAATRIGAVGRYVTVHLIAQTDRIPTQRVTSGLTARTSAPAR